MYKNRKIILIIPAYDEEAKIGKVLERVPFDWIDTVLVVDDGSTDETASIARAAGAAVLSLEKTMGVGAALRAGLTHGRKTGHDVAVIMAGNHKDDAGQIPRLLDPICDEDKDFVMGSRYLAGGRYGGDMPFYRRVATRLHPWMMRRFTGVPITESTNGFRAFKLGMLDDPRIRLDQRWLDGYGLEVYLLFKALKLNYEHAEVPCSKIYPSRKIGRTKMKPFIDWWDILKPVYLLGLGLRR